MVSKTIFTSQQISQLDSLRIPTHVAIIPDGNRRWAKKQNSLVEFGHKQGADAIIHVVKAAKEIGIKVLTFYIFSTENWSRPRTEVAALMWLLQEFLNKKRQEMCDNGIRLQTIGEPSRLPRRALNALQKTLEATQSCQDIDLVLAINYGSRDEMRRAVQRMIQDCAEKKITSETITEETISAYLDTSKWPDPDLLIRTSGENRLSNFLLWQNSYAEICVLDLLWPDFKPIHLLEAVQNFQNRERRLGGS